MLKNSLMSPEIEYKIHHSEKFLIDLDATSSETSDENVSSSNSNEPDGTNDMSESKGKNNNNQVSPVNVKD